MSDAGAELRVRDGANERVVTGKLAATIRLLLSLADYETAQSGSLTLHFTDNRVKPELRTFPRPVTFVNNN